MTPGSDVPIGWRPARLKHVAVMAAGGTPSVANPRYWTDDGDGHAWVAIADMTREARLQTTSRRVSEEGIGAARLPLGRPGTVLFAMYASLGAMAVLDVPATWNQAILGITPRPGASADFVRCALVDRRRDLLSLARSNTQANLNQEQVGNLRILVPALGIQRRIAQFLDRECERIRAAIRVAGDAIASLTRSERTIADAVVHGLPCLPLKAVATIHSGVTLNEAKAPVDAVRVPYLRVANVKAGWLELEEIKEVPISPGDIPHCALKPGDLLLTEGGDLDKLGRGALWAGDISPCLFQNHVFAVRPRRDAALPAFLSWATRSSAARSYFEATASRITNIASTNRSKLGRWPVPEAPIEEQRRRVAVAESAWERAQHAIRTARGLTEALTAYRSSLFHEAVTGKLDVTAASDRQMDERLHAAAEGRLDEVSV